MRPTYSPITPSDSSCMPLKNATTITIVGLPTGKAAPTQLQTRYTTASRKARPDSPTPISEISCSG